ncbi:MAG: transketolase [Candidatus Zixiibacteriota bacterium]|nr:MAG: transketolase [candidate division Zixibacteria bacterium]
MFDKWRGFRHKQLPAECRERLARMAVEARGNILKMTTVAGSGHPGGSMSSLEIFLLLYNMSNIDPKASRRDDRDRIIVSHGHTSPGVYASLAAAGFFDIKPALYSFRKVGSPFEGHVEQSVPGVEWDTGNLGQGLSVGVGKAIYARLSGQSFHTYVAMGDGEQQKGQIGEARRAAIKFDLNDITAVVDCNGLQISGKTSVVMPQNITGGWEADGWRVLEVNGHDLDELYEAFRTARLDGSVPYMILARTTMGRGVSFMENDERYHGAAVKKEQLGDALSELGIENNMEELLALRNDGDIPSFEIRRPEYPDVKPGEPVTYGIDEKKDNRSAFGKALLSFADANQGMDGFTMAVFDCDLAGSVKTGAFGGKYPDRFFQCGITEHSTATAAGALSTEKAISVWADFGVFGMVETYNQARLNDINHSNLKLFCTHSGVNVGEDGKTHQCIDYFGLFNSLYGWKVITPADPNQTDRVVRYVLSRPGNFAVVMGRSVTPIIPDESGEPRFAGDYEYRYGRMELIRKGEGLVLVAAGNMLAQGFAAWSRLDDKGRSISLMSVSDWSDLHPDDLSMLAEYEHVAVLEDHNIRTGLGTAVGAGMIENRFHTRLTKMGVAGYAPSGNSSELYTKLGLDGNSVAEKLRALMSDKSQAAKSVL